MNLMTAFSRLFSDTSRDLAELDSCRLSDLGLNRYDLFDARHLRGSARGQLFSQRRTERAESWLR